MHLSYPPELPVSEQRESIISAIREHQVLIIIGDTGSGKTTQLPKMCIEAGRGASGMIGCTQPRRIAAIAVADRVAEEIGAADKVGFKIRFHDQTSAETLIKFMTDGVLLAETRNDPHFKQYDTLIIDEAHERSLNIDFLLGYLKNLLPVRPDLKILISSATIDAGKFSTHFGNAPVITVSGRSYPITTLYKETDVQEEEDASYVERALAAVGELVAQPLVGDILVFMPTERDIADTLDGLQHLNESHLLLPLFGRLPAVDQRKIFRSSHQRKIIVATNVAETSITVPGIRFVVDTGLARLSRYNPRTGTTSLKVGRISRASCEQRQGRCGRTGSGTCIRLYSEDDFLSREPFTPPEIQRSNLAEVILQMIALKLGDPASFPFVDPPPSTAIRDGYRTLKELGAIADDQHLTANGRLMARLPLDPRISRIIIESMALGSVREVVILAAALSVQDPRVRPPEKEHKADEAHRHFLDKRSDFLTLLNIWQAFFEGEEAPSKSRLSRFCKSHFLSWQRMREWLDVHEQISRLLREGKHLRLNPSPAGYEAIHCALASGFLRNICLKKEKNIYITAGGKEVMLFPGSALYNKGPQWAVASEFIETTQLFARTVAAIEVEWLERLGGPLCKRSWSDPHWEKKSGKVIALERVNLFGLTIVAGRKVEYGRINETTLMEARDIFIRSALVDNQLGGHYPFLEHNVALVARFQEVEERVRRRDIVVDPEVLYQFYANRLGRVYDRFTLNRMLKGRKKDSLLYMTEADICNTVPDAEELYRFPQVLRVGEFSLELSYVFNPGNEADGVTVRIPHSLLSQLNPQVFEWLVPGILPEKLLQLLKRLPKNLRRRLVPLPDAVDRIMDELVIGKGSLYQELERVLSRRYHMAIQRSDWQADLLPAHLRMRFQLVDDQDVVKTTSRVFDDLLACERQAVSEATAHCPPNLPPVQEITSADLDSVARTIPAIDRSGRIIGLFFPALKINEGSNTVQVHYIDDETKSRQLNRLGLQFLYSLELGKTMSAIRSLCKTSFTSHSASWLSLGAKSTASDLRAALQAFILDELFATRSGELPSCAQFQKTVTAATAQGALRTASILLDKILDILRQRRLVLNRINEWSIRAKANKNYQPEQHAEYTAALEQIVPVQFLQTLSADQLQHKPRYLQALALRIERAEHSPLKDRKKAERLLTPVARVRQMTHFNNPTHACLSCQQEYLELLEEFRVSLFAPELGTAQPVSEKRLLQKWQEVENICMRVE